MTKEEYQEKVRQAKAHSGPQRAQCAACGEEIAPYESRYYGITGAVHATNACHTPEVQDLFPIYYTDG